MIYVCVHVCMSKMDSKSPDIDNLPAWIAGTHGRCLNVGLYGGSQLSGFVYPWLLHCIQECSLDAFDSCVMVVLCGGKPGVRRT